MSVALQVEAVRGRVAAACGRAGRDPADVTVIAVAKYVNLEVVQQLIAAGIGDIGENQAQQLRDRARLFPDVRWHAIGPLQRNKAKYVAELAHAFHALDRAEVATALSQRCVAIGRDPMPCYLQVNLAGEATKAGVEPGSAARLLEEVRPLAGVRVVGLMAMPPLAAAPEDSRRWFRQLADLAGALGLPGLSMGTSADFEVAVEEGATAIRVGGALST